MAKRKQTRAEVRAKICKRARRERSFWYKRDRPNREKIIDMEDNIFKLLISSIESIKTYEMCKMVRQLCNCTLIEVAEYCEVSKDTISRYENGDYVKDFVEERYLKWAEEKIRNKFTYM